MSMTFNSTRYVLFSKSNNVGHLERNSGEVQAGISVTVTQKTNETKYEEKKADYDDDEPRTEGLVTMTQPCVLPQTGQTVT